MTDITFTSLAQELGVTPSVVSRVMKNNSTTISIGKTTKKKILEMAWERGLQLSQSIGIIAPALEEINTFFYPAAAGLLDRCAQLGFGIFSARLSLENSDIPDFLLNRKIAGVVSLDNLPEHIRNFLIEEHIPIVVMNPSAGNVENDAILFNDYQNMAALLSYLKQRGYTRYIYISYDNKTHYALTVMKSLSDFLSKESFDSELLLSKDDDEAELMPALEKLIKNSDARTVFITPGRFFTIKILEFFSKYGKTAPKNGGIAGSNMLADYYKPKLTTIHYPFYKMGIAAIDMMKKKWDSRNFNLKSTTISATLFKNEST